MTMVYTVRSCNSQWTGSNANRELIPFSHAFWHALLTLFLFIPLSHASPSNPIYTSEKPRFARAHTRFMKLLSESEMICCKSVICYFILVACRQTVRYLSCGARRPPYIALAVYSAPLYYTVVCLHTIRLINVAFVDFSVLFRQIPAVIGLRLGIIKLLLLQRVPTAMHTHSEV